MVTIFAECVVSVACPVRTVGGGCGVPLSVFCCVFDWLLFSATFDLSPIIITVMLLLLLLLF
jgi:hypothetical protein